MDIIIFLIIGAVLFCITVWVHRHTYFTVYEFGKGYIADLEQPMELQVWMVIIMAIFAIIPIVNIVAFMIGAMGWGINYSCDEIRLGNTPKWCKAIQNFLTKEV